MTTTNGPTAGTGAKATVVIVPRERLSATPTSLANVLINTPPDVPVLCIDAGHTRADRRRLAMIADDRTRLLPAPRWRTPNEARNLALPHVTTDYVVYVDNDALVRPGWLDALVSCAEDTGAWVVGPLTLIGPWETATVHIAGGRLEWDEVDGEKTIQEYHDLAHSRPDDVVGQMHRSRTDLAELHCALVRRSALAEMGGFDEAYLSTHEQIDLCLRTTAAGGEVWFEPASVATYIPAPPLALRDLPFYFLRWSERWNERSLAHFKAVHGSAVSSLHTRWLRQHRFLPLFPLLRPLTALFGWGRAEGLRVLALTPVETVLNRLAAPLLERAGR